MEKFTLLDNALKAKPELLQVFIGEDEAAALAAAQEIAPVTAEEFSAYRAERAKAYPAMEALAAVLQKVNSDVVFAAKLDGCEDIDAVYSLCESAGIASVSKDDFAAIYEQLRTAWDAAHQAGDAELTEGELATVVGGASIWKKVGSWFKKNAAPIIGGVVAVASVVAGICVAVFGKGSVSTSEMGVGDAVRDSVLSSASTDSFEAIARNSCSFSE